MRCRIAHRLGQHDICLVSDAIVAGGPPEFIGGEFGDPVSDRPHRFTHGLFLD
jgi:hypothetical protein